MPTDLLFQASICVFLNHDEYRAVALLPRYIWNVGFWYDSIPGNK